MDWLRRNWPDLLIGVALIAVIAGIIATLISGGSFFPSGNRTAEPPAASTTPLSSTDTPGGGAAEPAGGDVGAAADVTDQAEPGQVSSLSTTASSAGDANDAVPGDQTTTDDQQTAGEAQPADGGADAQADQTAAAGNAPPVAVLPPQAQPVTSPAASDAASTPAAEPAAQPAAGSASSTAAAVGQPAGQPGVAATADAPYRVSVGAYSNRENAERQAEAFAAAGYPVFIGAQGDLSIVLVGPYDTETEARSVATAIRAADLGVSDPTVYEFTPDDPAAGTAVEASAPVGTSSLTTTAQPASSAAVPAAPVDAEAAQTAGEDTVITSAPSNEAGVRYLQAGAYGNRDSSLPQRDRLEGLGFVVTERVEDGLIKLLIGPFDTDNLGNAQGRLEAAGIASFPR